MPESFLSSIVKAGFVFDQTGPMTEMDIRGPTIPRISDQFFQAVAGIPA